MELKNKITQDIKQAMKDGNNLKKTTLRMVLSEFQYAQTAQAKDYILTEEEACKVIKAYHKKLDKSLKDYPEGEQRKKIVEELAIVSAYLPAPPSKEEIESVVTEILATTDERHFGKLIKASLAKLGSSADGRVVGQVIKEKLAEKN